MLQFGIISAATYGPSYRGAEVQRTPGSFHGTAFSSLYNGYDESLSRKHQWTFAAAGRRLEGARIAKIWDPHREWAEQLAKTCFIPEVCSKPEDCSEGVDGVIIVDDGSGNQSKYAEYPLKKGVPTFCDKPIAMKAKQAEGVAELVRATGTPFMSASSLRFVPDIVEMKSAINELGNVHMVTAVCGNELIYYGIHALSMYYGIFGGGARSCINVGQENQNIVRVRFDNRRDLVLMVAEKEVMQPGYQINLYGTAGWRSVSPDLTDLYFYLQEQFLHMVQTGDEPVPVEEEVELIAVLEAGKRSLTEGREVDIEEVLI